MKMDKSISVKMSDGIAGLRIALAVVPDDAKMTALTEWRGQGYSERQEVTGFKFTWTEEV